MNSIFEQDIKTQNNAVVINNTTIKEIYKYTWEARKIVNIPVNDALRNMPIISLDDETKLQEIQAKLLELGFWGKLREALIFERRDGGSALFWGYEYQNPEEIALPPNRINPINFLNVLLLEEIETQAPTIRNINAKVLQDRSELVYRVGTLNINKERLTLFKGLLPNFFELTNLGSKLGFSSSVLEPIYKDIYQAVMIRQSVYKLSKKSNYMVLATDTLTNLESNPGEIDPLTDLVRNLENTDCAILDGQNTKLEEMSVNFGALPELIQIYLKILASALDVPVTRFLGVSNSGLTQSAEGDLESYYNLLQEYQEAVIKPKIYDAIEKVGISLYGLNGINFDNLVIKFPPLWNQDEEELTRIKTQKLDNIIKAENTGFMDAKEAIDELNASEIFGIQLSAKDLDLTENEDLLNLED